ncbi:MAG TPA: aldo/keto reductase [Kofleriaceae bacterium]|nr:aldo/keto reductase [Kofleriaceae bacterium]
MALLGFGCMRATEPVIRAALDAGITLLDTADAYGDNELAVAAAIVGRDVEVVSKGGLVQPGWRADGRASHLLEAAKASRDRLGRLDAYLLHAVDPRVALATSVRALAKLRDAGITAKIGVSNVSLYQLDQACAVTSIDLVETELSPWKLDLAFVRACEARGIRVLAYRPLGGPQGAKRLERGFGAIAKRLDASPAEVALAWLRSLSPVIVPIPGASRVETARSCARVIELDDDAKRELAARFVARTDRATSRDGEVVMILGIPGAGKSTLAADYVARGYTRLNRDDRGGTLRELAKALDAVLAAGTSRVVVDNTYATRTSRAPVIAAAHRHGLSIRCAVVTTSLEDAQHNAAARAIAKYGRLPEPVELARDGQVPPGAQFRFRRQYEPPRIEDDFDAIDELPFVRRPTTGKRALIVELDHVVWRGRPRSPDGIELCGFDFAPYADRVICATTWQPEPFDPAIDAALAERLGRPIHVARCTHAAGPPVCWCRKPLPGLAIWLATAHGLALEDSVHVGRGSADRGFAMRAGMRFVSVDDSP